MVRVLTRSAQVKDEAEDKERKKREKEEKEASKVLLRDQRRRIRNKCDEFDMNRSQTEDLSLALPLEQVCQQRSLQFQIPPLSFCCCNFVITFFFAAANACGRVGAG